MSFKYITEDDKLGLLDRLLLALESAVDDAPLPDIIEFAEGEEYLNIRLLKRQRLILKLYYRLELTDDELYDVRKLLACDNQYAKLHFPGLRPENAWSYSAEKLRNLLRSHYSRILVVIAGRRSGKSVFAAVIDAYELFCLLKAKKQHGIPGQPVYVINVATEEKQALDLLKQVQGMVEVSPYFKRVGVKPLESELRFPGRHLSAISLHSKSTSVRGKTAKCAIFDEFAFFNTKEGSLISDSAMWAALSKSVMSFKREGRLVVITSPLNKAGIVYTLFEQAESGKNPDIIAFQMATWEMNSETYSGKDDAELASEYLIDAAKAEMEIGGQWAEQSGTFLPEQSVRDAGTRNAELGIRLVGDDDTWYCLHLDLAKKRDSGALAVGCFNKRTGRVQVVHMKEFSPQDEEWTNEYGELDLQRIREYVYILVASGFQFKRITLDQYNSLDTVQEFRREGLPAEERFFDQKYNMAIYGTLRSLVVGAGIEWYQESTLETQLKNLTRRFVAGGKFIVEAPLGFHDDMADAVAAVAYEVLQFAAGMGSGVHLGGSESAPAAGPDTPAGLEHLPGCDAAFCDYGCPVQAYEQSRH